MKRHISIFALLLSAFAAVGPVETAKAVDGVLFISDKPVTIKVNANEQIVTKSSGFGDYQTEFQLYNSGTANKFKAVVPDGYRFKGWSTLEKDDDDTRGSGTSPDLCSKEFSAEATIDGSLIEGRCATTARWFGYYIACPKFIKTWTITAEASPEEGGSVAIVGQEEGVTHVEVDDGGSVKLTATANEGWVFVKWSDGVTTSSRTIEQIKANATYTAEFKAKAMWNLTFEVGTDIAEIRYKIGDAETTTATNATVAVLDGTTWSATATAKRGYSDPNRQSGTATADRTITFTASPHQYTVDYDLGDGEKKSGGNYPVNENFGNSFYVSAPVSPSGRDFLGWIVVTNKDDLACAKWGTDSGSVTQDVLPDTPCANGKTGNVFFKNLTSIDGDQIWLRAKWSGLTRTITVTTDPTDAGSASGGGEIEDGTKATLEATPNAGYSFCCWTNGNEVVSTDNPWTFTVTADATYTAVFTGNVYTVTFVAFGGDPAAQVHDEQVGENWVLPAVNPPAGKVLDGWYGNMEGTGEKITSTTKVDFPVLNLLYAKFTDRTEFDVIFVDKGGGNGAITNKNVATGTLIAPLVPTTWTRKYYTLVGWNPPLPQTVDSSDLEFTAVWWSIGKDVLDCPNLDFEATGNWKPSDKDNTAVGGWCMRMDDCQGTDNLTATLDKPGTLTFNWKSDGETKLRVKFGEDEKPLTFTGSGWKTETFEIPATATYPLTLQFFCLKSEFQIDGFCAIDKVTWETGVVTKKHTVTFTDSSGTIKTNVVQEVEEGAAAVAPDWTLEKFDPTACGWDRDFSKVMEDITVNAVWTCRVVFVDQAGGNSPVTNKVEYKTVITEGPGFTAPKDHHFGGWDPALPLTALSNTTVSVIWTQDDMYTVTFHDPSKTFADVTRDVISNKWATAPDWSTNKFESLAWDKPLGPIEANTEITAVWTCKVEFVDNEFDHSVAPSHVKYDETVTAPVWEQTGYTLTGWQPAFEVMASSNSTYVAVWAGNVYTLRFDAKGGSPVSEKEVTYGQRYGTLEEPKQEGFSFTGWFLGETKITAETVVTTASNHTLTAKWEKDISEISAALDCDNLVFEATGGWNVYTNREYAYAKGNDRCLRTTSDDDGTGLTAIIKETGTLSFHWKCWAKGTAVLTVTAGDANIFEGEIGGGGKMEEWEPVTGKRIEVAPGASVTLKFECEGCRECAIDYVTWTPEGGGKPTPGDPVEVMEAGVENGVFSLTIPAESGIEYGVWTNADLTVPVENWGLMEMKKAEGLSLDFSFEIIPSIPQLFFRAHKVDYK